MLIYAILIFIILFYLFNALFFNELFNDFNNNIKLYVIHLERSTDRIPNIKTQQEKTKHEINIFNAVDSKDLDKQTLIDEGILSADYATFSNTGHYACFLSHKKIIGEIAESKTDGYSIVFEDDFNIISDHFDENIKNIINDLNSIQYDFDIIFLGNFSVEENIHDKNIINNVYTINDNNITTEGYIINNKSAKKIHDSIGQITSPIDYAFKSLRGNIKTLIVYPFLVTQIREYPSLIG